MIHGKTDFRADSGVVGLTVIVLEAKGHERKDIKITGGKNMTYKEFEKKYIGGSDIAALILVGYKDKNGVVTELLKFGSDGDYNAYMVPEKDVEIGKHYDLIAEFDGWLKIYDDDALTFKVVADKILVYRAGEMGCIIQYFSPI